MLVKDGFNKMNTALVSVKKL